MASSSDLRGSWSRWARELLRVRRVGFDRVDASRAGVCIGLVVGLGWVLGDLSAGLTASVGCFTALYGNGRPFRYRAVELAVFAVAFALVVALGARFQTTPWVAVVMVALVAVLATWLCQAFDTGPPGAYMIVLAAATATNIPGGSGEAWRLGLLVLGGGSVAWALHMAGALAGWRRPEKTVVAHGVEAVAALLGATGDRYGAARDQAARAMHACWVVLVNQQSSSRRPDRTLAGLRGVALELHQALAQAVRAHDEGRAVDADVVRRVRTLGREVADPSGSGDLAPDALPLGGPTPWRTARSMLAPGSPWRPVLVRVAVAALVAGGAGLVVGLDHAYWAIAAAVLVLVQGLGWAGTLQRATLRLAGTLVGLLLAAAVLAVGPTGLPIAAVVAILQFAVQWAMPRNYGIGVVFVTPLALTIGSAGRPADLGGLLLARGLDTAVGCTIGVLVFLAVRPGPARPGPASSITATLRDVARLVPRLADGETRGPGARSVRRDLNRRVLALGDEYEAGADLPFLRRDAATTAWWPALDAVRHLAHRTLALCWAADARTGSAPPCLTGGQADVVRVELHDLIGQVTSGGTGDRHRAPPSAVGPLGRELEAVRAALPTSAARADPSDRPAPPGGRAEETRADEP